MRVQILSDLHLEKRPLDFNFLITTPADIIVLAGDIGDPFSDTYANVIIWCTQYSDHIVIIAGNNEYRNAVGYTIAEIDTHIKRLSDDISASSTKNVTYLQCGDSIEIGGVHFIGATLWSHIPQHMVGDIDQSVIAHMLRDIYIQHQTPITLTTMNVLHLTHRTGIYNAILKGIKHGLKNIVISHHAPFLMYSGSKRPLTYVDYMYGSDLSCFMGYDIVRYWIYGHTHKNTVQNIQGTACITNQYGNNVQALDGFSKTFSIDV
jgi:predicted phosphodiesterase